MKPFFLMPSKQMARCYLCWQHFFSGDPIAWNPETKQAMHEAYFRAGFHPSNVPSLPRSGVPDLRVDRWLPQSED